jgi:hypothetical protein
MILFGKTKSGIELNIIEIYRAMSFGISLKTEFSSLIESIISLILNHSKEVSSRKQVS